MLLYQVIFKDGTKFDGGSSIYDSKWNEIPNKEIKLIKYVLPDGNFIVLHDYKAYAYVIEATMDFYGPSKMQKEHRIHNVYLMGLNYCDEVVSYRITLRDEDKQRYRIGDITRRQFNKGKEFRGKPVGNHVWKRGIDK